MNLESSREDENSDSESLNLFQNMEDVDDKKPSSEGVEYPQETSKA